MEGQYGGPAGVGEQKRGLIQSSALTSGPWEKSEGRGAGVEGLVAREEENQMGPEGNMEKAMKSQESRGIGEIKMPTPGSRGEWARCRRARVGFPVWGNE